MAAIIAALVSFLPEVPGLIDTIQKLIARGKKTGELSDAEADALTVLAMSLFNKYDKAAPPPPGA